MAALFLATAPWAQAVMMLVCALFNIMLTTAARPYEESIDNYLAIGLGIVEVLQLTVALMNYFHIIDENTALGPM